MKPDTYREALNDLQVEIEALRAQLVEQSTKKEDLISRQDAINAICGLTCDSRIGCELYPCVEVRELMALPPAQLDLSDFCDKLWKAAYERGKAKAKEELIQCRDCEHATIRTGGKVRCDEHMTTMYEWDYCSRAERREEDERSD